MTLWRISNHNDLAGLGGERSDGRWHTAARGRRIIYLSEHPALALIEILANLKGNPALFPERYQLMKITAPDAAAACSVPSPDWRENLSETQSLGNAWLAAGASALLAVPSAPSPESLNYLLNPAHPDAKNLIVEWCEWLTYDKRLFHAK